MEYTSKKVMNLISLVGIFQKIKPCSLKIQKLIYNRNNDWALTLTIHLYHKGEFGYDEEFYFCEENLFD